MARLDCSAMVAIVWKGHSLDLVAFTKGNGRGRPLCLEFLLFFLFLSYLLLSRGKKPCSHDVVFGDGCVWCCKVRLGNNDGLGPFISA